MPSLGMRGTGSFSTDDRPKNWRQMILLLFPNANAPLTALLSMLKDEQTDDPEYSWFQKPLPDQRLTATASFLIGATSIAVTSGDGLKTKKGHVLYNELTAEVMWVTADGTSTNITVARGKGTSASASSGSADTLIIIGSEHAEGSGAPTAMRYDPTKVYNYTQIFRNTIEITETAKATNVRWADGQAFKEDKREGLELHSIEMERAFLWGARTEDTSSASQPQRTTGGLSQFITTNVKDFAGAVTIDAFENFLEDVFENGSTEKIALVGNRALNVFNKLARAHYTIEAEPSSDTYGMKMTRWETPYGTLIFKQHPLLSNNATFNSWGFIIDPKKVIYRYLRGRDTEWKENIQAPDADGVKCEFKTECGLELQHESCHAIFKRASAFSA